MNFCFAVLMILLLLTGCRAGEVAPFMIGQAPAATSQRVTPRPDLTAGDGVEALAGPPPKGSTPSAPDATVRSITAGDGVEASAGSPPKGSTPSAPDATVRSITATPPVQATPTSTSGVVSGKVCYPSSETPPLTIYLQNKATQEITPLNIERGEESYSVSLANGSYIAYARTVGMGLGGAYTCAGAEDPCPFQIKPGQTLEIDLCGWYPAPGLIPAPAHQPEDVVLVRLLQNMYVRSGPHLSDPELELFGADTTFQATGRTADHGWILVEHPELKQPGWLHAPLVQVIGDLNRVPIVEDSADAKTVTQQFVPAIWRSEHNQGMVLFKGEIRDQAGQPVNGFSILLDNGTWSVLSHPTGASHHYPDVGDGRWDVVIDNETDAAGWWTMTVVRYECPDFERGFNAQCKEFTPLSETKLIKVVHPDENIIEANWTCLQDCDQGLYLKAYRKPVAPVRDNWLLYIEDRALKSSPVSPVFDRPEMRRLYDGLPETEDGLRAYLAKNRPILSPNGQYLLINAPEGVTWLAELVTGELREVSRPAVVATWGPDSRQVAYLKKDTLYILDLLSDETRPVWRQDGLVEPAVEWLDQIVVKTAKSSWQISPDNDEAKEIEPVAALLPADAVELIQQKLPPGSAWALSHDRRKVAYNLQVGGPLRNAVYLFDIETKRQTLIGPINGYRVPEIRWSAADDLLFIGATNPKFPSGGAIFTMKPEANVLPDILLESDTAYLVDVFPEPE